MNTRFISEPITLDTNTLDTAAMARGEPSAPHRFTWRDDQYEVAAVLKAWKEAAHCRHGSGEQYIRKHWFEIRTTDGTNMKLYFERQPRAGSQRAQRWWLHSLHKKTNA